MEKKKKFRLSSRTLRVLSRLKILAIKRYKAYLISKQTLLEKKCELEKQALLLKLQKKKKNTSTAIPIPAVIIKKPHVKYVKRFMWKRKLPSFGGPYDRYLSVRCTSDGSPFPPHFPKFKRLNKF